MTKEELRNLPVEKSPEEIRKNIKENWNKVAKPLDGLGELEEMFCRIGAAQHSEMPELSPRAVVVMCADNGIVEEGVSQAGQDVTLAVAHNMGMHKSSVCKMAEAAKAQVIAVDIGINADENVPGVQNRKVCKGTRNFLKEPAMSDSDLLKAIETGITIAAELKKQGFRILATGEMGIGNTTTSAAMAAVLLAKDSLQMTGRGAGLDDRGLLRKQQVVRQGIHKYGFDDPDQSRDAFEILRCLGGLDIAGLCGVFIGGALYHIPVIIDGVISAVAALCAQRLVPGVSDYMLASHCGAEPALAEILQELELNPVIYAGLKLGEGTGAVMLFPLLDMADTVYKNSSSFDEIGVDQYKRYPV